MKPIVVPAAVALLLISGTWLALGQDQDDGGEAAAVQEAFEAAVAELNAGDLEGFLDTVHEEALSFYACGPTSGKQGREACALDWQLFFNTTTAARFETRNEQYRVIGDTGIAYGEYSLSVNYDGKGRQTVHEETLHDDLHPCRRRLAHRHAAQHAIRRWAAASAQSWARNPLARIACQRVSPHGGFCNHPARRRKPRTTATPSRSAEPSQTGLGERAR